MKVDIICSPNPYVLDVIKDAPNVVALTRKNADFIEAVVQLDSNYKNDSNPNHPNSTAYWFDQMINNNKRSYDDCLRKCIEKIDNANSTHLQATKNGRQEMFNIIKKRCPTPNDLRDASRVDPSPGNAPNNLFYLLCATMRNNKGDKANNISFASKFIAYARKYLNNNDTSFSKYDSVVAKNLSSYEHYYVDRNKKIVVGWYMNNAAERKKMKDEERQEHTYDTYIRYMETIDKILKALKDDNGITISKEEFDHIIWYSSK